MEQASFGILAACLLFSAFGVVTAKNLVRSVLWLATTLIVTAVLYVTLGAPYLAGIQIILYTGGVITLMLFGVMLTRRHEVAQGGVEEAGTKLENERSPGRRGPAALAAAVTFGLVAAATFETENLPDAAGAGGVSTETIGRSFLTDYLLAFEVLSLLLLAAMVGAIVLARRHDHGDEPARIKIRRRGPPAGKDAS